jgi:hypothetical protein
VILIIQGDAAAQAVFDVLSGKDVRWQERGGGWHRITFEGTEADAQHIKDLFPNDRIGVFH